MIKTGKLRLFCFGGLFCLLHNTAVFAQIPDSAAAQNLATVTLDSSHSSSIYTAEVNISGYKQTKPYIVQREVFFHKGETISRDQVVKRAELSRQQLMNTTLFVEAEVSPVFISADTIVVNVHVKERWYIFPLPYFKMIDRNFNTWWVEHKRSLQRIDYGIKFFHNNVSGRNDKLNIGLNGGYTQQVAFRYENPYLDPKLRHGMNIGFSYSRNREINYATDKNKQSFYKDEDAFLIKQIHIDAAYTYRPAVKTRHSFRISYNDVRVDDTVSKLNPYFFPASLQRVRFPEVSYSIQYYNVDYIPYPLKGFWGEASAAKRFGSKNNMWQLSGRGTFTTRILPENFHTYLQFQASGIIKAPFKQPYYNTRMFGSSDFFLRGMEYYVIDGVAGGFLRGTLIKKALDIKIKNPIKIKTLDRIPVRMYLKTFSDVGYAYNCQPGNSMLNNRLLRTWGFGIDIVSVYDVVLKLEYSFNQLGDRGFYVHSRSDF